jgi:hypothetical protein
MDVVKNGIPVIRFDFIGDSLFHGIRYQQKSVQTPLRVSKGSIRFPPNKTILTPTISILTAEDIRIP